MNHQVVIHAQVVDQCGFVLKRWTEIGAHDHTGFQPVHTRSRASQLRPENFEHRQQASSLNYEHDDGRRAGRLVALERDASGIWGTWTSGDLSLLRDFEPLFVSAEVSWHGSDADADEIQLRGAGLVRSTAATGTAPALILAGRLGRPEDRRRWRLHPAPTARLERAADAQRRRKPNDPIVVWDEQWARDTARMEGRRAHQVPPGFLEEQDERRRTQLGLRPVGRFEHSVHRGKVLRVS